MLAKTFIGMTLLHDDEAGVTVRGSNEVGALRDDSSLRARVYAGQLMAGALTRARTYPSRGL